MSTGQVPLDRHALDACAASAFVRRLHEEQRRDPRQPLQLNEYFGSITALHTEAMGAPAVRAA